MRKSITQSPKGQVVGVTGVPIHAPDCFTVDYDNQSLEVVYDGEKYEFDLTKGDVGDFWFSFTDQNGTPWDINFYQEDESEVPIVGIYELEWRGRFWETGDSYAVITVHTQIGDQSNYFDR